MMGSLQQPVWTKGVISPAKGYGNKNRVLPRLKFFNVRRRFGHSEHDLFVFRRGIRFESLIFMRPVISFLCFDVLYSHAGLYTVT
ncbi:hypothetical protein VIGAN_01385400 [Vigna angularis var. angularis]|uniref:Uncharacterized protein n=1 Tax=Vigna angularis var. angularis TaxID=157739 RepID=A0A0S3R5Z9_PHAAN|nr:hypothetical protein VIGAN_01385400 [Vigna angularis var. angularis]